LKRCPRLLGAVALGVGLVIVTGSALAAPKDEIRVKRAQAQQAQAQVEALGMRLESAIERYNEAEAHLAQVRAAIADNQHQIGIVRANVRRAKVALAQRLVVEYRVGDPDVVAAILGARSLDDMLGQVSVLQRAGRQTQRVITDLVGAQRDLARRQAALRKDRRRADALVAQAAAAKQQIQDGIAQQRALIRGLEGEIVQLQREEAARQRRLAEEAHRRLAAQQAAAAAAAAADPGVGGSGGGGEAPIAPPPANGSIGSRVVAAAMRWLGTPYSWGGGNASGPTRGIGRGANTVGFDCSGLTLYAYAQVGISLGHFTGSQWKSGSRIGRISDLAVGDLVFFGGDLGHMGLYIGGGQMVHAPHTGDVVKISTISSGYYASAFAGGVRPY
jgi:cell wall-associated NlpC family hydrolase